MDGKNSTIHTYALRYYVHHQQCNKRMFGKTRQQYTYYTCQLQLDRVGDPESYAGHPRSVYVREDALLELVQTFFNERVLGRDRTVLLRHQLRNHDTDGRDDTEQRITAIEKTIAEITRRQLERTNIVHIGESWLLRPVLAMDVLDS